jgi:hypothetical protein
MVVPCRWKSQGVTPRRRVDVFRLFHSRWISGWISGIVERILLLQSDLPTRKKLKLGFAREFVKDAAVAQMSTVFAD